MVNSFDDDDCLCAQRYTESQRDRTSLLLYKNKFNDTVKRDRLIL